MEPLLLNSHGSVQHLHQWFWQTWTTSNMLHHSSTFIHSRTKLHHHMLKSHNTDTQQLMIRQSWFPMKSSEIQISRDWENLCSHCVSYRFQSIWIIFQFSFCVESWYMSLKVLGKFVHNYLDKKINVFIFSFLKRK